MRVPNNLLSALCLFVVCQSNADELVGPLPKGGHLTATHQLLHPAGQSVEFSGRPVDLALSPDGRTVYVKDNHGLLILDATTWTKRQELPFESGGGSAHGIVVTRDGASVFATTAQNLIWEIKVAANGKAELGRKITLPGPAGGGN